MEFLSAHWKHLLLANYSVDRTILEAFVPAKTKLDAFEGNYYLSLVAFLFDSTRILKIPVPFHRVFEEVNLRFYVVPDRDPSLRAVTFLREIVPKMAIPLIANSLFNENYAALPMGHRFTPRAAGSPSDAPLSEVSYTWGRKQEHLFSARINQPLTLPSPGSLGEFITEHYWGYAKGPKRTLEYQVKHPQWVSCLLNDYTIQVDFGKVYGEQFSFLQDLKPSNVLYALGSPVTVSFPGRL